ncbi:MAG: response regulator [Acidobacteriota bacterium]
MTHGAERHKRRVLVAEDEPHCRFGISVVLRGAGYEVIEAGDGDEALMTISRSKSEQKPLDLLILDIQMPRLDGFGVLDELARRGIAIPTLIITGHGDRQTLVELLRRGCADYVDKPFAPDDLLDAVKRAVNKAEQVSHEAKAEIEQAQSERADLALLAGGVAQDLNNYLALILGHVELAKHSAASPSGQFEHGLEMAKIASLRARELTSELLSIARGVLPNKRITALKPLIEQSVTLASKEIRCQRETELAGDLWPVEIDATQIQRVFQNLIVNAGQTMPEEGTLAIRACNERLDRSAGLPLHPGPYVHISVSDTGAVILGSDSEKRRFEPCLTAREGGAGPWLTVARSIIQNHGGYLATRSAPALGTAFDVYLPAAAEAAAADTSTPVGAASAVIRAREREHGEE